MRMNRQKTVILANGDFPRKGGVAFATLAAARRVVACDGAALSYRRRFRRWPDYRRALAVARVGARESRAPLRGGYPSVALLLHTHPAAPRALPQPAH